MKRSFCKRSVLFIFLTWVLSTTGCVYSPYGYSDGYSNGYWESTPGHGYPSGYYRYYDDDDDDHPRYDRRKKYNKDDGHRWFNRRGVQEWRQKDDDNRKDSDNRSFGWRSHDRFRPEDRNEDRH